MAGLRGIPLLMAVAASLIVASQPRPALWAQSTSPTPPAITAQPQSQSVEAGKSVTFSVSATGNPAPSYAWFMAPAGSSASQWISGATSASYTISAAALADSGAKYWVYVKNSQGGKVSSGATLTVTAALSAPAITAQPQSQSVEAGGSVTFSVAATGNPAPSYQWHKTPAGSSTANSISGATSASYTISAAALADSGAKYWVYVKNSQGSKVSLGATLTVTAALSAPAITEQPQSQSVAAGGSVTFSVAATGNPAPSYAWFMAPAGSSATQWIGGATSASYTISAAALADSGAKYWVYVKNSQGSKVSSGATLTVTAALSAPAITAQPQSQSVEAGKSATFSVAATGNPAPSYAWFMAPAGSSASQWISGATSASYTISAAALADSGAKYWVYVKNSQGSKVSSGATLTVTAALSAPAITEQPQSQSVAAGGSVTFSVAATGNPAPSYQWHKTPAGSSTANSISGATSASYTISAAALADSGAKYWVYVKNSQGNATSTAATLTVLNVEDMGVVTYNGHYQEWSLRGYKADGIVHYVPDGLIDATRAAKFMNWYKTCADHYKEIIGSGAGPYFNDANVGAKVPSVAVVEKSCGAGCGAGMKVEIAQSYYSSEAEDPLEHWIAYYELGRGSQHSIAGNDHGDVSGYGIWAVANPAYMSMRCGRELGGDIESNSKYRGFYFDETDIYKAHPEVTMTDLYRAKYESSEIKLEGKTLGTADIVAAMLDDMHNEYGSGAMTNFFAALRGTTKASATQTPPEDSAIEAALCNVYDSMSSANVLGGGAKAFAEKWKIATACDAAAVEVAKPEVTSGETVGCTQNAACSYQIKATNDPDSYAAADFPAGLSVNASNGLISGTPTEAGTWSVSLSATNSGGTGTGALTLTISKPASVGAGPAITKHPDSASVVERGSVTFSVAATGTGPLQYQWYHGMNGIQGAASAEYTYPSAALEDDGTDFQVRIWNDYGFIESRRATLTVTAASAENSTGSLSKRSAPAITAEPKDQTVAEGESAVFSVSATGKPAPSYQWYKSPSNDCEIGNSMGDCYGKIDGETGARYKIASASRSKNGKKYMVRVKNSEGKVFSDPAVLTVEYKPTITAQPRSQTVDEGASVTFSVEAEANPAASYRWVKIPAGETDEQTIAGATQADYTIASVSTADSGAQFVAYATNSRGFMRSSPATLTMTDATPPSVALVSPADGDTLSGVVTLEAEASDSAAIDRVEFHVNGHLHAVDKTPPYTVRLNTRDLPDTKPIEGLEGYESTIPVETRAYDTAGNTAKHTVKVRVSNGRTRENPVGEQKIAVLMVRFQDDASEPWTADEIRSFLDGEVGDFYKENSFGQTWLAANVYGWYSLETAPTCDGDTISGMAEDAADKAGVPLDDYTFVFYAFPDYDCHSAWGGGRRAWFHDMNILKLKSVAHEFGHDLGLGHSKDLDCGAVTYDPAASCTKTTYGDPYSIMGSGTYHFPAQYKEYLGWMPVEEVVSDGTYELAPIESAGSGTKGLKVASQSGDTQYTYYIEYRKQSGFDASMNEGATAGVLVRLDLTSAEWRADGRIDNNSYLLDMTPGTESIYDAALAVGETYTDPGLGFTITPVSRTADSIQVKISGLKDGSASAITLSVKSGAAKDVRIAAGKRQAALGLGAGSFEEPVTLRMEMAKNLPSDSAPGLRGTGVGVQILVAEKLQPARPARIEVTYDEEDVAGLDPATLVLARYDEPAGVWLPLPSSVDRASRKVTGLTDHFSLFQVMGSPRASAPEGELGSARVYPNPFYPNRGQASVAFDGIPAGGRVKVYTLRGELVWEGTADGAGVLRWPGVNRAGLNVASGIYLAHIDSGGKKILKKLAVIR